MTLYEVWNPIRNTIASDIKDAVNAITNMTLTAGESAKIEALCYNYCHVLLNCDMLFSDESTIGELQTLVRQVFRHKAYALVSEWNMVCSAMSLDSGKSIHQESFYDVADTPHVESKDWTEMDVKIRQVESIYNHSQAIKELYNELKCLVQTIY